LGQKKPLKTVLNILRAGVTGLKPGLNERSRSLVEATFLRRFFM
jgi:hypothetical protein